MESYVERPPLPGLAGVVRTVWIQRTGEAEYVQRHLPTGGVEIHFPIVGHPHLLGPLTVPRLRSSRPAPPSWFTAMGQGRQHDRRALLAHRTRPANTSPTRLIPDPVIGWPPTPSSGEPTPPSLRCTRWG